METLTVVNRYRHQPTSLDVVVHRPSPLGNRFSSKPSKFPGVVRVATPEEAILRYEKWLRTELAEGNPEVTRAIDTIPPGANLVCFCAPRPCHAHVIARIWQERRARGSSTN